MSTATNVPQPPPSISIRELQHFRYLLALEGEMVREMAARLDDVIAHAASSTATGGDTHGA